jgi:hypothetical protein
LPQLHRSSVALPAARLDKLNSANQKISDSLAGLKDIVQFLNFATEAVGLAASLAKLAAA